MDDDVMEWACKAAEAEYKLRQALIQFGMCEENLNFHRKHFEMRGDERATQIFEAVVSEMTDQGLIEKPKAELKIDSNGTATFRDNRNGSYSWPISIICE